MTGKRKLVHTAALFLLPLIVSVYGVSLAGTAGLVLLMLLWRWGISLSTWVAPARSPELELRTICASHFVEKVRWCMDRLGVDYTEIPSGGTLNAFYLGQSVPLLRFRTGGVRSSIGNSAEILRYLWGRYGAESPAEAAFLEPTPERLELETKTDRCGADLQVWVYYHLLDHRDLTLHAWGVDEPRIPAWQRLSLKVVYPLQAVLIRRAFQISDRHHQRAIEHLETLMGEVEERLSDGRGSILGGDKPNFSDFAYASIMGLWLQPAAYGGGRAENVKIAWQDYPEAMQKEIEGWTERFPKNVAFVEKLYANHR